MLIKKNFIIVMISLCVSYLFANGLLMPCVIVKAADAVKVLELDMQDDPPIDTSGNGHVIINQNTIRVDGPNGKYVRYFQGGASYMEVENHEDIDIGNNNHYKFSAEFWFKANSLTGNRIFSKPIVDGAGTYRNGFSISVDNGKITIYTYRTSGGEIMFAQGDARQLIFANAWYHIALTYDGENSDNIPRVYLNGAEIQMNKANSSYTGPLYSTSHNLIIGNLRTGAAGAYNRGFNGNIGSFSFYKGLLTPEEAIAHYNNDVADYDAPFKASFFSNDVQITDLNEIPVATDKIVVDLDVDGIYPIVSSSLNQENIRLINVDTDREYEYEGTYEEATKKYTISDFGGLEYGSNYKLIINGSDVVTQNPLRKSTQEITMYTEKGLHVENSSFTNQINAPVQSLKKQEKIKIKYDLKNYLTVAQDVNLIAVLYKGNTIIKTANMYKNISVGDEQSLEAELSLPNDVMSANYVVGTYTVRTFLCSSLETMNVFSEDLMLQ